MKKIIVLITVDTLRADVCGFSGSDESYTPNLDALCTEFGTAFSQAFASGTPTYTSFPGIMSGLFPSEMATNVIPNKTRMLAERMKALGYRTTAIIASNPYLTSIQGYNRGFDEFITIGNRYDSVLKRKKPFLEADSSPEQKSLLSHKLWRKFEHSMKQVGTLTRILSNGESLDDDAVHVFEKANQVLGEARFPLFLWIHLMDVHSPYRLPETSNRLQRLYFYRQRSKCKYHALNVDEKVLDDLLLMYHESVRFMDIHTASFVENIIAEFGEEASIILTSDHGEEFMERGHLIHINNPYVEVAKVPFVIFDRLGKRRSVKGLFSLADTSKVIESISRGHLDYDICERPYVLTEIVFREKPKIKLIMPFSNHRIVLRTHDKTVLFQTCEKKVFSCNRLMSPKETAFHEVKDGEIVRFFERYFFDQRRKILSRTKFKKVDEDRTLNS